MYECMYVCTYVCVSVCMHVCVYVYVCVYVHVCMCVCVSKYIYLFNYIYILVYIQGVAGGKFNILRSHSIGYSKQKCIYVQYICPIPSDFRDRAISQYRSLDLAPNIVLPSRRTAPLYEA